MKIYLISILLFIIISCDKQSEKTIIEPKFLYPDSSDHCGHKLIIGSYVRFDNSEDTLFFNNKWARTKVKTFCPMSDSGDIILYCILKDSITFQYIGPCTVGIPPKTFKYYFTEKELYFDYDINDMILNKKDSFSPYFNFIRNKFIKIN